MQKQNTYSPAEDRATKRRGRLDESAWDQEERLVPAAGSVTRGSGVRSSETVRTELVERVRRQIQEGDYLTEQRIDITVARLIDELRLFEQDRAHAVDSRMAS